MAANEVGTITVRGDTRGIKKITTALREMGKRSDQTEKKASRLGKTIGRLAAGVSVGLFARAVINSTREQEQAIAQLNATLQSTGRFSEETSRALQAQAAALQKLTTFGDEAIISAQSQLLTFKELGSDVFPRATKAVLDLSAKMGTDLQSSVIQIGKALNDPTVGLTALTRVGITFTEQQKDQIKTLQKSGDILGAQKIILEELESQFEGSAEAARNTFGGALDAVKNAFGDLLEGDEATVGAATEALNQLEETLNDPALKEGFGKLITAVATSVEWLAKGVTGIVNFSETLGEFIGELVNGPTIDDPAGIRKELEAQRAELKRSEEAWIQWGAADYQEGLRARIAQLEDMLDIAEELQRTNITPEGEDVEVGVRAVAEGRIEGLDLESLDALLIEVDTTKARETLAKLREDLARDIRDAGREASEALSESVAQGSAELAGPSAEAALRYSESLQEILTWEQQLAAANELSVQNQQLLTQARENAIEVYDREIEAIEKERLEREAQLTPAQEMIAALETELELMKLGANEREREIVSRKLAGEATEEQLAQIDALILKRQEAARGIEALDEFRSASADLFVDFASGSKSMGDAFDDFARRIRQRALELIAEKLIEQIFGAFGTAGGGGGGGGFASIIGSFFGGGAAGGGPLDKDRVYRVNELGPEMLSAGGKDYLLAPEGGDVTPAKDVSNELLEKILAGQSAAGDREPSFRDRVSEMTSNVVNNNVTNNVSNVSNMAGFDDLSFREKIARMTSLVMGGGRAGGGTVYPGRLHPVNEYGPEMLSVGSRDYLLAPPQGGSITPASDVKRAENKSLTVNITVPPTTPTKTIDQAAKTFAQVQRRAETRNS